MNDILCYIVDKETKEVIASVEGYTKVEAFHYFMAEFPDKKFHEHTHIVYTKDEFDELNKEQRC